MSQIRSRDETAAPASAENPGRSGRGAMYIERLERYPERDFEPAVIRRARALIRAMRRLPPRNPEPGAGGSRKTG